MKPNQITGSIVNAAMTVHTALGPGLLESVYESCLVYELRSAGLQVSQQVYLPVVYREVKLENALRLDLLVANTIVVEIKAVEAVLPVHCAQLLSYLRLSGKTVGLLLNFNVTHMRDGVKRISNFSKPLCSSVSSTSSVLGFQGNSR